MKLSICSLACTEVEELRPLIYYLKNFLTSEDEIVITVDGKHTNNDMISLLEETEVVWNRIDIWNVLGELVDINHKLCSGDIIFGVCPDELPTIPLLMSCKKIMEDNPTIDAIAVPRINIFTNLTKDKSDKMYTGPRPQNFLLEEPINEYGWHCWPDYQIRLMRNIPEIIYGSKTHSGMVGYKKVGTLPPSPELSLLHVKSVEHQERILKIYDKIGLG